MSDFAAIDPADLQFQRPPDRFDTYAPNDNSQVLAGLSFPKGYIPCYSGKGGWVQCQGVALVNTGNIIRLCPIRSKGVTLTSSIPVGQLDNPATLRAVADMLLQLADQLEKK